MSAWASPWKATVLNALSWAPPSLMVCTRLSCSRSRWRPCEGLADPAAGPGAGSRVRLQQPTDLELRRDAARAAGRGAVAVQQLHQIQRRGRVRPARPGLRAVPAGDAG